MVKKTKKPSKVRTRKTATAKSRKKSKKPRFNRPYLKAFLFVLIASIAYLAYLDVKIISKFEGRIWQLPARVYARPLEIYEGMDLSVNY